MSAHPSRAPAIRRATRWGGALMAVACGVAVASSGAMAFVGHRVRGVYVPAGSAFESVLNAPFAGPSATAAAAKRGINYGGTTAQQEPFVIMLSKDGKHVVRITNEATASCASGFHYLLADNLKASLAISGSGAFRGKHTDAEPLGDHAGIVDETVSGKAKGKKITGSLKVHVDVIPSGGGVATDTCDLTTKFTLVSAKGREFAGTTSQGTPALVELTSSKKKVNHFHIGWRGSCTPSGSIRFGEFLRNFPIKSGRFGETWTQRFNEPSGEYEVDQYTVSGKIKGAKASGKFHVKDSFFEASGASQGTCDSGSVSWKAASG
jgi:hypothetical protein